MVGFRAHGRRKLRRSAWGISGQAPFIVTLEWRSGNDPSGQVPDNGHSLLTTRPRANSIFCHLSPVQQRPKQSLLRKVQNGLRQQSWAESTKCGIAQLVNEEVRLSVQDFYSIQPFFRASGAASRFSSVLQVRSTPDQWLLAVFTTVIAF